MFDAFDSGEFRRAIEDEGRKKLISRVLWTETSLVQSVVAARTRGYEVAFVEDCSGGVSPNASSGDPQNGACGRDAGDMVGFDRRTLSGHGFGALQEYLLVIQEHAGITLPPQERLAPTPTPPP